MADASFDGTTLVITLPVAQTTVDVAAELYSAWKEWLKTGTNARFLAAFRTTGGDPLPGGLELGAVYFLRNDLGWRIKPDEADHEVIIAGNLYPENGDLPMFVPTTGAYTVSIQMERSSLTQVVLSGSGVTAQDKTDIAELVRQQIGTAMKRAVAVPSFHVVMFDAANPTMPKAGLTVTGQLVADDGSLVALTNTVAEIGDGLYRVVGGLTAEEMDGVIVSLLFTAAGAVPRPLSIVTRA